MFPIFKPRVDKATQQGDLHPNFHKYHFLETGLVSSGGSGINQLFGGAETFATVSYTRFAVPADSPVLNDRQQGLAHLFGCNAYSSTSNSYGQLMAAQISTSSNVTPATQTTSVLFPYNRRACNLRGAFVDLFFNTVGAGTSQTTTITLTLKAVNGSNVARTLATQATAGLSLSANGYYGLRVALRPATIQSVAADERLVLDIAVSMVSNSGGTTVIFQLMSFVGPAVTISSNLTYPDHYEGRWGSAIIEYVN